MRINRSRVGTYLDCPRRYYWTYVANIVKPRRSAALRIGSAAHKFLELWYTNIDLPTEERKEIAHSVLTASLAEERPDVMINLDRENEEQIEGEVRQLMNEYVRRWGPSEEFTVLEPEVQGTVPLIDGHQLVFQTDAIVSHRNAVWLLEHKTTSQLGPTFIEKFMFNHQIVAYVYGASVLLGQPVVGVIVNALRKSKKTLPEFYRESVIVTKAHIRNMLQTFSRVASEIEAHDQKSPDYWPQDTNRCHDYGKCPFWDICAHGAEPELPLYIKRLPDYVDQPGSTYVSPPTTG